MVPLNSEELQRILSDILARLQERPLDPQNYLEILYHLATTMERVGFVSDAVELYKSCLNTAQEKNIAHRLAFLSALHLSNIFAKQAHWTAAQKHYTIAQNLIGHLREENRYKYHTYLVLTMTSQYIWSGQLEKAYQVLHSTIEGFRSAPRSEDSVVLGHLLSNYGTTLSFMDRHEEAIRAYTEALQYLTGSPEPYVLTLGNLALAYVEHGNHELAYLNLEKAQQYIDHHSLKYAEGYIQMDWGIYWTAVKEYKKAIHALNQAIKILEENKDIFGLYFAKKELATAIGKSGERGEAEQILRTVIQDCETYGLFLQKAAALEALAEIIHDASALEEAENLYRKLGNPVRADKMRSKREEMETQ